jgi:hypothetical protein
MAKHIVTFEIDLEFEDDLESVLDLMEDTYRYDLRGGVDIRATRREAVTDGVMLKAGQIWRTRGGELTTLSDGGESWRLIGSLGMWAYADGLATANSRSVFGESDPHRDDLMELVSEGD